MEVSLDYEMDFENHFKSEKTQVVVIDQKIKVNSMPSGHKKQVLIVAEMMHWLVENSI
jgi:hypothetical protein